MQVPSIGASTTGTAANVRAWAGHRQAFPLGQCHTPLTSLPTLGRALTDGNLHEVGFVNSFLEHLAHQACSLEDDSADEGTKYEAHGSSVSDQDREFARQSRDDYERDDDDDYYARHKKRRSTRWRSNYPSIKKPKRPCTGDVIPSSSSRRRASVSAGTPCSPSPCHSHDPAKREMRSRSVSSYFAMRRNEESSGCGLAPVPVTSSVTASNGSSPLASSSSPPPSLLLPPAHSVLQHPHHPHHYQLQLAPEWWAVAGSTPVSSSSSPRVPDGDLPAVPSPPPHGPISLPAIQASYYYYSYDSSTSCELPSSSHHGPGGGGEGEGGSLLFRLPGNGDGGLGVNNPSAAIPLPQPAASSSSFSLPFSSRRACTSLLADVDVEAIQRASLSSSSSSSSSSSPPPYNFWPVSAAQQLPDDRAHDSDSSALMGAALLDDEGEEASWLEDLLRLEPRSSLEDGSPVVTLSPDAPALASAQPGLPQGEPYYHHHQPHHYKQQEEEEEEQESWQAPVGVQAPGEATPFAELCGF